MRRRALLAAAIAALPAPLSAQAHHAARPPTPAAPQGCTAEHAAMGHCTLPAAPASAPAAPDAAAATGTALEPGFAPAPAAARADYADRIWGAAAMVPARAQLAREHGGARFSQAMIDLFEAQLRDGRDALRWDAEAWLGGDIDRVVLKSEGEGARGRRLDQGEVQALWSRAIGPYFDLQAGLRQDFAAGPKRTHAVLGVEGLAPYWFDVEAALFLSTRGDLTARIEASADQRITQALILQPRIELNLAAQDVAAAGVGSGLSDAELGVRLRTEIVREFAPYVGIEWQRRFGDTARFARAAGEGRSGRAIVLGVHGWF